MGTFEEKAVNAKFSLKLQLSKLEIQEEILLSTHINELKSIMNQLAEIGSKKYEEDAKAILLNSLSSNYANVIFTSSQFSTRTLDEIIATLLAEEKRKG